MANWRAIAMAMRKPDFTHLPVTIRRWKGLRMEKIEIHRDQIDTMKASNLSTMPMGLLNMLSEPEILDLLAYIRGVTPGE